MEVLSDSGCRRKQTSAGGSGAEDKGMGCRKGVGDVIEKWRRRNPLYVNERPKYPQWSCIGIKTAPSQKDPDSFAVRALCRLSFIPF